MCLQLLESDSQRERRNRSFFALLLILLFYGNRKRIDYRERKFQRKLFEEEARLWAEVYGKQSDKPDLESLQRMLENMNHLLLSLELPWERFIPILYRSFALYMRRPDENTNNRKAYQLSAQLMDSVVYLSQHTNLIHHIHLFCNMQIAALEKLKNEKVEIEQTED